MFVLASVCHQSQESDWCPISSSCPEMDAIRVDRQIKSRKIYTIWLNENNRKIRKLNQKSKGRKITWATYLSQKIWVPMEITGAVVRRSFITATSRMKKTFVFFFISIGFFALFTLASCIMMVLTRDQSTSTFTIWVSVMTHGLLTTSSFFLSFTLSRLWSF